MLAHLPLRRADARQARRARACMSSRGRSIRRPCERHAEVGARFPVRRLAISAAFLGTERGPTENQAFSGAVSRPFTELSTVLGGNPRQIHRAVIRICCELRSARGWILGNIPAINTPGRGWKCQGAALARVHFFLAGQGLAPLPVCLAGIGEIRRTYARGDTHLESWPSGLNDGVHLTFRWIPWKTQNLSCDAGTARP